MKKYSLRALLISLVAVALLFGCAKGYESQKTADDLKITLSIERYPLVKGDNAVNVRVTDASGKAITDAVVSAHYFMPPMPGMAPMDYTTQAVSKGGSYSFSANVPMEGGWKVEIAVARPGKQPVTAIFNVDAR